MDNEIENYSPTPEREQIHAQQMAMLAAIREEIAPALERLNFWDNWCE